MATRSRFKEEWVFGGVGGMPVASSHSVECQEIISFLKEAKGNRFVTLSPSADLGTNALHISLPTKFNFRYGKNSFLSHIKAAEKLGIRPKILPLPSLKYDIDTSHDLKYLQGLELET